MFWRKKEIKVAEKGPALACLHHGVCSKNLCPLWVQIDLTYGIGEQAKIVTEGKCALAWTPSMLIELKQKMAQLGSKVV